MSDELVGRALAHFRVVRKLGQGGMGVVYEATDLKLKRTVALKVLPAGYVKDAERRGRFLREARAAAAVAHPNIAAVYEVGEEGDLVFIAMGSPCVEAPTLEVPGAARSAPRSGTRASGSQAGGGSGRSSPACRNQPSLLGRAEPRH